MLVWGCREHRGGVPISGRAGQGGSLTGSNLRMIDIIRQEEGERRADKRKVCTEGSLEPSQGLGLWRNQWECPERVWEPGAGDRRTQRLVGDGGRSNRVRLKNLDIPPTPSSRAREWCGQLLEATLAAHGCGLEGEAGCPLGDASPGEEASEEGSKQTQDKSGAHQEGLLVGEVAVGP